MQFNQRPTGAPVPNNNGYWQQLDRDIARLKRRSRRQFLTTASGLVGGTALLLGGSAWLSQPNHLTFPGAVTCKTPTAGTGLSPQNPTTLKVCQINNSINFFTFYVAQQQGYFTAEGLTIPTPPLLQVGSKVVTGVVSGGFDIGNGVITDAFAWATNDSQAKIIGAIMNGYIVDIVASNNLQRDMNVSPTSPLNAKIMALKGKKVGITGPGSGTQALLIYLFRLLGMDAAKDMIQVSLGSNNTAALAALKAGRVDALSFFSPVGEAAEDQKIGDILISPVRGDIPGLKGDVHGVIYTKQSIIDAKPQAIAAYIRALNQAEAFIQNNAAKTKELLGKYIGLDANVTNNVFNAKVPGIAKTPEISQAAYNVAGQFHVTAGLIVAAPKYSSLVATSTIDNALGIGAACQS